LGHTRTRGKMYRIRLASSEETVFRTLEELAQAVSSGVVSADAEVFHKAGNRWLPINTHPDYRAVVTGKHPAVPESPAKSAVPPAAPLPEPSPPPPTAPPAQPPSAPEPLPEVVMLDLTQPTTPTSDLTPTSRPLRAPRHSLPGRANRVHKAGVILAAATGAFGLALGAGAVLASRPLPTESRWEGMSPSPDAPSTGEPEQADPDPSPEVEAARPAPASRHYSDPAFYPAPSKPLAPRASSGQASQVPPAPPRVVSRASGALSQMPSYFEAYADARAEMNEALDYVGFRQVFAPSRFSGADSLRAARRMVSAAGNILRVYRGREVMLEQTYRPGDPDGHGSLRESFEASEAARSLLSDLDSLYGVLVAEHGKYALRGEAIAFESREAASAYAVLHRAILQSVKQWQDSSEAPNRVTMPRLLRAIGPTLPPPAD